MVLLELTLIFLLHCQGISGETVFIYGKPGEDAVLPCGPVGSPRQQCFTVSWIHRRNEDQSVTEVLHGNIESSSGRAGRLSLDAECSLVIKSVSAEDVGLYDCHQRGGRGSVVPVYLSILTVSRKDAGPQRDGEVKLECSLLAFIDDIPCQKTTFRWMDETGAVLLDEYDNMKCVSEVTVKRQSGSNMTYTCVLIGNNIVQAEAHYTPKSTGPSGTSSGPQTPVIVGAVLGAVAVLVAAAVAAAIFIQSRKRAAAADGAQKSTRQPDEPESNLTYVTVNHANHQASPYRKVKEEVTYSSVKHSDRSKR